MVTANGQDDTVSFDHINLNTIDPGFKPVPDNVYNFEVNSIKSTYVKVGKPDSPNYGKNVEVLKGSFTIVDDPEYSGRKVWYDFWATNKYNVAELRKLQDATGVLQGELSFVDWASQFATLNPPAKFQCFTTKEDDRNGIPRNVIKFMQARSI